MKVDEKIIHYFEEKRQSLQPPDHLRREVLNKIDEYDGGSKIKKRLIAFCLAISFIIPTSTLSYTAYLADELYGSMENVISHFSSATADSYVLLQAKLLQAKGELTKEDFQTFMEQLKTIVSLKMDYGDSYGNMDITAIPDEKVEQYKEALSLAQPYFDRLNGNEPLKDHLSAQDYEKYIEALMMYEAIIVQSGINPSISYSEDDIDLELRDEFIEARNTIEMYEQSVNTSVPMIPTLLFSINGEDIFVEYGLPPLSNDSNDYRAYTHVLKPLKISANDDLKLEFAESVENAKYYIIGKEGEHSLTEFTIPEKRGKYTYVVEAKYDGEVIPYVFVVSVQ